MHDFGNRIGIISPHIDDAILSLGGLVLNESLNVEVINVFTITNYTINGVLDASIVTDLRKGEEKVVSELMGFKPLFLDYIDAILRVGEHEDEYIRSDYNPLSDSIFYKLQNELSILLKEKKYDNVFFPLGIGNHIDHLILGLIGKILKKEGINTLFYEDLGYEESLFGKEHDNMKKIVYKFSDFDKKMKMLRKYVTQLDDETADLVKKSNDINGGEIIWF